MYHFYKLEGFDRSILPQKKLNNLLLTKKIKIFDILPTRTQCSFTMIKLIISKEVYKTECWLCIAMHQSRAKYCSTEV